MENLPKGYKKGVTRVSELVSFVHPFKGTDGERRYKDWLKSKNVNEDDYLHTAQDMGTYVHEAMEYYILKNKKKPIKKAYSDCKKEIEAGIQWLKQLSPEEIEPEKYVLEKNLRFQGAVDLLYKKEGKWVLADWKTYGICKKRFNLDNKWTVPTSKKKKVELQMSIYCYALRQQGIEVELIQLLFLHEEGLKIVEMKPLPNEEIEEILKQWEEYNKIKKLIPKDIIMTIQAPLKIHLQTAPCPYQNVSVDLDLTQLDNGQTVEEAINEAVKVQKRLHNNYVLIGADGKYNVGE